MKITTYEWQPNKWAYTLVGDRYDIESDDWYDSEEEALEAAEERIGEYRDCGE